MADSHSDAHASAPTRRSLTPWARVAAVALAVIWTTGPAAAQDQTNTGVQGSPAVCVAIPLPTVHGATGSATDVAASVRELIGSYLQGPGVQVVLLEARLQAHAVDEASRRGCGHLLTVTMTRKPARSGSALGRALGSAAGTAAWRVPYGGSVGAAVATSAAVGAAQAVAAMAESTRAKDELRLDYQLARTGSPARPRSGTFKAKARADGEDLVTPLVGQLAESIVAGLTPPSR